MEGGTSLALEVAMGIALAACAGLRAFLPLFVVGVAGRLGWVTLGESYQWLASWPALVVFAVAVVAEVLSDKIPIVDHVLDLVGGVVRPAAGALLAASVLTEMTPLQCAVVGILVGGSSAGLVHLTKAKVRLFSSVTTAGLGNPVLSLGEDVVAFVGTAVALWVPVLVLILVLAAFALLLLARRRFRRRAARLGTFRFFV